MKPASAQLVEMLRQEIAAAGSISFARFMERALECPLLGFYEQERDSPGRRGHFFTSVSVGPMFGLLLAWQLAEWLRQLEAASRTAANQPLTIVEAGAHDGRLAADILGWLHAHRTRLWERVQYAIIEPSARRQTWQRATLANFADHVRWYAQLPAEDSHTQPASNPAELEVGSQTSCSDSGPGSSEGQPTCLRSEPKSSERRPMPAVTGIIFSNELLDAMPAHRFGWDARQRRWFEWGVGWHQDRFVWVRRDCLPPWAEARLALPSELLAVLPDGFTTEIGLAAEAWWQQAARCLHAGWLVTFDYGLEAEEFFHPQRAAGTLRAYYQHRLEPDVLARPGEQDLTAHINFTAIQQAGEAAGLRTEDLLIQAQFLTRIAERVWRDQSSGGHWDAAQVRQFQTLVHPEHLGRAFRVLIQARPPSPV